MSGLTIEVEAWNIGATLREEFLVPAVDAGDHQRAYRIRIEIQGLKERVLLGDTCMHSDILGCWIKVIESA